MEWVKGQLDIPADPGERSDTTAGSIRVADGRIPSRGEREDGSL